MSQFVYAAAQSAHQLRCGDHVDVEWEASWFPGVVTDLPADGELAVSYTNGDFESSVPVDAARLRKIPPPKKRPVTADSKRGTSLSPKLADAANAGDIGLVLLAIREGCNPALYDEHGYGAVHWAASPDEGMPGDTASRRACVALLARAAGINIADNTTLGLRGVQHAAVRNFVGCVKTFAHLGADLSGTVHWATSVKAHGALRELLALGVKSAPKKSEWEGCTPLMLAAAANDSYGMQILIDDARLRGGAAAVEQLVGARQLGNKSVSALSHAADAAADGCVELLLASHADPTAKSSKGETALVVARQRAQLSSKLPSPETHEASLRCVAMLTEAIEASKRARAAPAVPRPIKLEPPSAGLPSPCAEGGGGSSSALPLSPGAMAEAGDDDDDDDNDDDDELGYWDMPIGELVELAKLVPPS